MSEQRRSPVVAEAEAVLAEAAAVGDGDLGAHLPGGEVAADGPPPGSFRATLREARNYRELRHTPYGLRPLLLLIWLGLFLDFNSQVIGTGLQGLLRDIDLKAASYFRYIGFIGFVLLLARLGVAFRADRTNRVRLVGLGLIVAAVFTAISAAARTSAGFEIPDLLGTAAFTVAFTPVFSLLADYYPSQTRGKVFALLSLTSSLTATVVPVLAGELVDRFGWRSVYAISSVPVLVIGVLVLLRLRDPVRGYMERRELGASEEEALVEEETTSFAEAVRTVFGIRTLRRLFVAAAIAGPGSRIYSLLVLALLIEKYRLSSRGLGYFFAAAAAFSLPGTFLSGGLIDDLVKRRPSQILRFFGVVQLLGIAPIFLWIAGAPLWLVLVGNGVFAFVEAVVGPALDTLTVQITPANIRNTGVAVRNIATVTRFLGAYLVGPIVFAYGTRGALTVAVPFFVVAAVVYLSAAPLFEFDMRAAFAANLASAEWRRAKQEGKGKLLVCRDVDVAYSGVQVLFGVDFDVEEGEVVALLGTNGAGKSTLLRAISGTQQATGGAIVFDGRDITFMPPNETATRGIVFMPGGRGVFPGLTVRENLLLGTWMAETEEETRRLLGEVIEIFPVLAERADTPAGLLSGGEQQQLSLAQAFLAQPRLLMIDELSLGLAPAVVGQLIGIVQELNRRGITIIVVEQSVNVALTIAGRAIFMEKGEVKFNGPTADLLARPDILRSVYVKGTGALTDGAPAGARRTERQQRALDLAEVPDVLQAEGLRKTFGGITAVDDVSLSLREGEVLGVIGPNGSGKTTLFELISGFQRPDAGRVRFRGEDITERTPEERARIGVVRRFQDARLFPSLTVYETLLVALEQRLEARSTVGNAFALPRSRRAERRVRARAERLVELLELGGYRDKFVKELSTGLRRIVDLACVLANEPKLLLLDEPSSGIAQAEAEGLAPLLRRIRFETGCSLLVIEHDMPLISAVSDELLALESGRVVIRGTPEVVLEDERVIESYLGGSQAAVKRSGSLI